MNRRITLVAFILLSRPLWAEPSGISFPDFENLEPGVRQTLTIAREALETAIENTETSPSEKGRVYGRTGRIFHAHHLFEVAEACYLEATRQQTENEIWAYLLGYLYQDTSRLAAASDQFRRVLTLDSGHVMAMLRLGLVLSESADGDDLEEASALLQSVLDRIEQAGATEVPSLSAVAHAGLGRVAAARGQWPSVVDHYSRALEVQPQATQLHFPLAVALRNTGDLDAARVEAGRGGNAKLIVADRLIEEVGSLSSSSEMFLTSGAQALKAKRFDLAEQAFREAIAANPENKRAHHNLAVVLQHNGRLEAAETSVRAALAIDPDYFFAHLTMAALEEARSRYEQAVVAYKAALALDPKHLKAQFGLANVLMRSGRYEEAIEHYRAAVVIAPALIQARYLLALAQIAAGERDEARAVLEKALAIEPSNADVAQALARLVATLPAVTRDQGLRALALAESLDRSAPGTVETMAMALAAAGQIDEAVAAQRALLNAARGHAPADVVDHLEHNLRLYLTGQPSDRPWP